jgi:dihydrolipoyl dehydrogenase
MIGSKAVRTQTIKKLPRSLRRLATPGQVLLCGSQTPPFERFSAVAQQQYDVIVIGAGPGGYTAAIRAAQLGLETAVVEEDKRLGGTCLLRGCIPTKAMLHSADILSELAHAAGAGIKVGSYELDFAGVMKNKDKVVTKNSKGVEFLFKKNRITRETGRGRLTGGRSVAVEDEGETRELTARRGIILAMGSKPTEIPAFPIDGKKIVTSDHVLGLAELPKRFAVLGAGAVGTEFASVFARFGSETTLIEMLPQLLPFEDADVGAELAKALKKDGIDIHVGTKLMSADSSGDGVKLELDKDGTLSEIETDMLLVAVGRSPVTADCGLEEVGVKLERSFVVVDEFMRTAVDGVYGIGDIVATPMLAHCASAEAMVAAEMLAGAETRPVNYALVPGATYCRPEVASVGLTEAKAKEAGYDIEVGKFPWAASGKARIQNQVVGFLKIIRDKKYDEILGVHIIGPHATDLIAEAVALMQLECTNEELSRIVHAHPTLGEAMLEASHAAAGHSISF